MKDKLISILGRFNKVKDMLSDPEVACDINKFRDVSIEHKQLTPLAEASTKFLKILDDIAGNKELIADSTTDPELKDMAQEEINELAVERDQLELDLRVLLIPRDPNDAKNCIVEIRGGIGGNEAGIFAGDLYRMYQKYAERNNFKTEVIDFSESERGGFKEITFSMSGEEVFSKMKFESGVHRVQRVPETESSGRLHTSAATVAVLPEAEDVDIDIAEADLRVDIFRAGGKGGQNVNKVETAVRMVHIPTGIVVKCQEERSQLKNRAIAMKVLRSRLYELEIQKQQDAISSSRKSMVKSGDRSEKIRTYNYPQNRVTDHRLEGESKNYSLREVVQGDFDRIIENLKIAERAEILKRGMV